MNKIFYFVCLLLAFTFRVNGQQDTIIYNPGTGDYTIQYIGEGFTGEDTLITLTYIPWTKLNPFISCDVFYDIDSSEYIYNWRIGNGEDSEQNLKKFVVVFGKNSQVVDRSTLAWHSKRWKGSADGEVVFINRWGWRADQGLEPTWSVSGLKLGSPDLPSIGFAYFQGKGSIPRFPYSSPPEKIDTQFAKLDGFPVNYVQQETIIPNELPDPFIPLYFLDTLINYNQRSLELSWITNQTTADKYDSLLNTAKTLLEGNHIPWVEHTLQTVLQEVDNDSSGNITSEAYALLRYNTEYLLENLPEVISPVLNSISPGLTLMPELEAHVNYSPEFNFTLSAAGSFFTDSTIIYFNNQQMETTVISDSIVGCQIIDTHITVTGDYPVWVSNYGFNSDTLFLTAVDILPEYVTPVVNCVQDNGDGNYTSWLGYINDNSASVHIGYGAKNMFWPCSILYPINRGQPNVFLPGRYSQVFSIEFSKSSSPPCADFYTWTLYSEYVNAADSKADPCDE